MRIQRTSLRYCGGVTQLRTLEDVLAWALAQYGELVDVIVQDEYTHDVIVRIRDGWQVFDTT